MIYDISEKDNNKSYALKRGDLIKLSLEENPTTGYKWQIVNIDKNILTITNDKYQIQSEGIGGGGIRNIEFKALQKGDTKIELKNFKIWEGEGESINEFEINLKVK